ncbi:MAG: hypothetical protein U1F66_02505 [bacterium]
MKEFWKRKRWLILAGSGLLSLIPPLRILVLLIHQGAYNPSNDDLFLVHFMRSLLEQGPSWRTLFQETFTTGHSHLLPMLFHFLWMKLTGWNLEWLLYVGIVLAYAKVWLLYDLVADKLQSPWKALLLPLISGLVFSYTQLSAFDFEYVTISRGLSHLGFLVGLWGLLRRPGTWTGSAWMLAGGLVASLSSGNGLCAWPVYFCALFLQPRKKWVFLAAWTLGLLLVAPLYAYNLFWVPKSYTRPESLFSLRGSYLLEGIGLSMAAGNFPREALLRGAFGLGSLLLLLGVGLRRQGRAWWPIAAAPAWIALFSLLNVLQIGLVRTHLAPWYASSFVLFWVGLAGLTFAFCEISPSIPWKIPAWACLALILFFLFTGNTTWADKVFYLNSRTPFAETCLRHRRSDLAECRRSLFQWGDEGPSQLESLSDALRRYGWSIAAPRQRWSLQGDFAIRQATASASPGIPKPSWWEGLAGPEGDPRGYRRLNLFLHAPNSVFWDLELPNHLQGAVFRTALAISPAAPQEAVSDGVDVAIRIRREDGAEQELLRETLSPSQREWRPLALNLAAYAGERVTLILATEPRGNPIHDWAMLRYPTLEIEGRDHK